MNKVVEELKYLKYTLFHPFDAFYEIKWRGKGNIWLATVLILAYGIAMILNNQYTGFVVNSFPAYKINSIATFVLTVAPLLLFIVSNWSVSTLCNGKGKIKDLYMVIGYAICPMLLFQVATIAISNIIILEEASLLFAFNAVGMLWFYYLVFCGVTTVHEYTAKESVITLITTAVAAIVIIFISVLYFSLMEQVISFISTLGQEFIRRW
ncbi:Yip1 family protein [Niameybacter massiliensis]|uniref:Yip1 family protein n=1 Tax=Holtiella tumoricola TaxID=3018743 RepID=A0AA42DJI0_9FIRM|nr:MULTISPECIES: Yip1 family protein [Lachnospirales]MDA3729971.1 Yip1 family protein [Holtiella tumoricola]